MSRVVWHAEVFGALDHRRQRGVQAAISQDRRRDAAHHVAQLDERALGVLMRLADQLLGFGQVGVELGLREADRHRQRHQPRLHAVVQVAFDAVPFGLRRGHRPLPGVGKRVDLVFQRRRRRRRQQPAVDGGVEGGRENQDRGGRREARSAASAKASGGGRNDRPASSSLRLIAIAAAGPMNAKTSKAEGDGGRCGVVDHPQEVMRANPSRTVRC